jgi:hypothetical protein
MKYDPSLLSIARGLNTERVVVIAVAAMMDEHKEPIEIASLLEIDVDLAGMVVDEIRATVAPKKKGKAERDARATRLPADWKLSRKDGMYGIDLGLTEGQVRKIAKDFEIYWRSTGKRMVDWSLTWQGWARREASKLGKRLPDDPTLFETKAVDSASEDMWKAAMRSWRANRTWVYSLGPEPGQPGCRVPADVLKEFGA